MPAPQDTPTIVALADVDTCIRSGIRSPQCADDEEACQVARW